MNDQRFHPLTATRPLMDEAELAELAASIARDGVLVPIVLDLRGRVIDGRNRVLACDLAGLPADNTDTWDGPCEGPLGELDELRDLIAALNDRRRHTVQRERG